MEINTQVETTMIAAMRPVEAEIFNGTQRQVCSWSKVYPEGQMCQLKAPVKY